MQISGLVVRARPQRLGRLQGRLARIRGVEIHAATPEGHLVLTLESAAPGPAADALLQVSALEGVLSVSLVYQYCDDRTEPEEYLP
ncbi:MAG: chaperone NapD [Rhodocyclales bacterium]|nr:chaperone NapD [Rhodocyclales bacterium]